MDVYFFFKQIYALVRVIKVAGRQPLPANKDISMLEQIPLGAVNVNSVWK